MDAVEQWTTRCDDPEDQPDRWREVLAATHLPWRVDVPAHRRSGGFAAWARRWWIDDLALVDCGCDPCSGSRRRREIASTTGSFVVVLFTLAGREVVEQTTGRPGCAPADRLPRRPPCDTALPRRVRTGRGPQRHHRTAGGRAGHREPPGGSVTGPAMRVAMDRWIERNLSHDGLTPDAVARAHGVSVRTVNRIFSATGDTLSAVVRARRLTRAREDLAGTSRPITAIAHRWGFSRPCGGYR